MNTSEFEYDLPAALIAQEALPERTASRMMVLHREGRRIEHAQVGAVGRWLRPGDLLVLNDTRVIPARVFGRRTDTGGRVELLLLEDMGQGRWHSLYRASRRPRAGLDLEFGDGAIRGRVEAFHGMGRVEIQFSADGDLGALLEAHGIPPLPPYIHRDAGDARTPGDRTRYQTVYARAPGAVAAPTAGLHFTPELLSELAKAGVPHAFVTLHVGPGTFKPVKSDRVEDHEMEAERYEIPAATAEAICRCREGGGRVVAVGSTTVRTLETVAAEHGGVVEPCGGRSRLFIYPPYEFRVVGAMLTNFHLPKSTLLMMVSALAGRDFILDAYREAVRLEYRFYSYGDCMLIV